MADYNKAVVSEAYCTRCGERLLAEKVGAETIEDHSWGRTYIPYTAYDAVTGMRNWATRYYCPNASWFNSHTDFRKRVYLLN